MSQPLIQGASLCLGWDQGTYRKSVCRHLEVAMYWFLFFFLFMKLKSVKRVDSFKKYFLSSLHTRSILWFSSVGQQAAGVWFITFTALQKMKCLQSPSRAWIIPCILHQSLSLEEQSLKTPISPSHIPMHWQKDLLKAKTENHFSLVSRNLFDPRRQQIAGATAVLGCLPEGAPLVRKS